MRPSKFLVLLVAALALLAGCSTAPAGSSATASGNPLGFTARTVAGAPFAGKSLAGKSVVMWFWAPWCPTCRSEAPGIARAAGQHPETTFVGVAALDQVPAMKQFVATYHLGFVNLADVDSSVWRHFGVTAQPAFAFVSPDGTAQVVKGALTEQALDQRLNALPRA